MTDHSTAESSADRSFEDRFEQLESALSHCQQDIEAMSASLNVTLNRMRELESRMSQLELHLIAPREEQELPDPIDERPPHY